MHTNIRLTFDQTLENLTGVSGPPWTQPRDELAIDLAEKAIDLLLPTAGSGPSADSIVGAGRRGRREVSADQARVAEPVRLSTGSGAASAASQRVESAAIASRTPAMIVKRVAAPLEL